MMRTWFAIVAKELVDALRDRKTLWLILALPLLNGTVMIGMASFMVQEAESQQQEKQLLLDHREYAPALSNYLERQGFQLQPAPADYRQRISKGELKQAVLAVPRGFDASVAAGEAPQLDIVSDNNNRLSSGNADQLEKLLEGYRREVVSLSLAWHGLPDALQRPFTQEYQELSNPNGSMMGPMISMVLLLTLSSIAMLGVLDSTAGERERGSLFPLMLNPVSGRTLVYGKWFAVLLQCCIVVVLQLVSMKAALAFSPGSVQQMMGFGWLQAWQGLGLLLPLAALLAAMFMALASQANSYKEGQAKCNVPLMLISFMPAAQMLNTTGRDILWQQLVPGLAQSKQLTALLQGRPLDSGLLLESAVITLALAALALEQARRTLTRAA
ncbi:ABC transporter permease [Chromobacterium sp. IIBBL 290-4]|uniref:ABC transporter permease n=1 Tax=Chromobacterium sp. IIBBL 290-4 TaxID=2953890 RepID=UPI0020B7B18D|nr:ABC transporter permease [Chromobacterium sp. IIBBL 290-4]UTH75100.1 ABC transporter permease subunit [Chromobacterium sp. IIBBL 290-4]